MFHDAVENFLGISADYLSVNVNAKINFLEYWGQLKASVDLPSQAAMRRLNDARVSLKHHGSFPSEQTVQQAKEAVATFFAAATPMVFGVEFDTVDMVDLVTMPEVAQIIRDAQTHADVGEVATALAGLDYALQTMLSAVGRSEPWDPSPFGFAARLPTWMKPTISTRYARDGWVSPLASVFPQIDGLRKTVSAIQAAMVLVNIGIDYPKYVRFRSIAPRMDSYMTGSRRFVYTDKHESRTPEEYQFCKMFVIESALAASRANDLVMSENNTWNPSLSHNEKTWSGPYVPDQDITGSNTPD